MTAAQIADGVFQLPSDYPVAMDAPLWLYAIRDDDVAIIDSAIPSTYDAGLGGELLGIGIDPASIGLVILTHGHPDHQGGAGKLQSVSGATIAAPLDDATWVEDPERQWRELWDGFPGTISLVESRDLLVGMCGGGVRVDVALRDGDRIGVGERELQVIQTRGHTRGHVALLDTTTGCLFSGDVVQGRGLPASSGRQNLSPMYQDVADYRTGLERLRATSFELLCPAHHVPRARDAGRALIDESLAFVDEVDTLVRDLVSRATDPLPTRLVAERIGVLVGCATPLNMQTVTVAVAHLTALAREGLIDEAWTRRPASDAGQGRAAHD
jgi:glyoxylase-like metal-dependent hydrolase (beta-lactamase superfamily II)